MQKELQEYIPRDQVLAECGGSDAYVYAFTTGCFPAIESLSEVCFEPGPPQFDSAELERTARTKKQQQQQQARGGTSANTGTSDKKVTFDAVSPVRSSLVSHSVSPANSADFDALLRLSPAKDLLHFKRTASTLSVRFLVLSILVDITLLCVICVFHSGDVSTDECIEWHGDVQSANDQSFAIQRQATSDWGSWNGRDDIHCGRCGMCVCVCLPLSSAFSCTLCFCVSVLFPCSSVGSH